jgi:hypothetical protein
MGSAARLRAWWGPVHRSRWPGDLALALASALLGVWVLVQLFPGLPVQAGSVTLRVTVVPAATGGLTVQAPPLGDLAADSFNAPARVVARTTSIDVTAVDSLIRGGPGPQFRPPSAVDLARAVGAAVLLDAAAAGLFGLLVALALRLGGHRVGRVALAAAASVVLVGFLGLLTHDPAAYDEPQRTGAWAALPELTPEALSEGQIGGPLGDQLARFGQNLTGFYAALTADARSAGLRDDSRVVLVLPDGLPDQTRATAEAWFRPSLVTGAAGAAQVSSVTLTDSGLELPDGSVAPLSTDIGGSPVTSRFVVLYLDPATQQLRAVDLVTVDGGGVSLDRRALQPEPSR